MFALLQIHTYNTFHLRIWILYFVPYRKWGRIEGKSEKMGIAGFIREIRITSLHFMSNSGFLFIALNCEQVPFRVWKIDIINHRRRQGGGHRERSPPPEIEKNCCRKMMLFPKALFLATTFPKIDKNSIFLLNLYQKFSKFSQNFQTICIFRPNTRKINAWFLNFVENRLK